ncbi:MAG: CPBP family intramembrane metalloprotease [Bacilli bacterium]|nr:CPBP family intramembrane metalloprotease [Bacilli bacterium]
MKNKNLIINIIKLITTFLIFMYSSLFSLIPIKLFNINIDTMSTKTNYLLTLFTYICLTIVLVLLYRKELIAEWKNFKSNIGKNMDTSLKYYFIGLGGMVFFNIIINFILKLGQSQNEQAVQSMIKTSPILMLICAGILAPITEEITFRKAFKNVFKSKWIFVMISGLVFGILHVINFDLKTSLEILYILPYGILGASFAYMDYEINSTYPSIFMHMIHNTVLTALSIIISLL